MPGAPPPGWYLDPVDARWLRYWDGAAWTAATAPRPAAPRTRDRRVAGAIAGVVGLVVGGGMFLLLAAGAAGAAPSSPASDITVILLGGAVVAIASGIVAGVVAFRSLTAVR